MEASTHLGDLQLAIMRVLWARGEATVADVHETLEPERGLALTTIATMLNVFQDFRPEIPDAYRDSKYVFLANIDPVLQLGVLEQVGAPKFVACDTMNYWIENKPEALKEVKNMGYNSVINLRLATEAGADIDTEAAAAKAAGITFIHLPFDARSPDPMLVDNFLKAVTDKANQPAFIHCASANRAAALWMVKRIALPWRRAGEALP